MPSITQPNPLGTSVTNSELGTDLEIGNAVTVLVACTKYTAGAGTWGVVKDASRPADISVDNTAAAADADNITFKLWLAAGTYQVAHLSYHENTHGICKIAIDGTDVLTDDQYSAGPAVGVNSADSISVATSGLKTIRVKCDGKNGSSSGYRVYGGVLTFQRYA